MNRLLNPRNAALLPLSLCVLALAGCEGAAPPLAPDAHPDLSIASRPVEVAFEKHLDVAGSQFDAAGNPVVLVWRGTVNGDPATTLVSTIDFRAPGTRSAGSTLHATVRWEITAGDRSFVAVTEGVVNQGTGLVRTSGAVQSGWAAGARVHQEGQLDAAMSATGFLRVLAGSAR